MASTSRRYVAMAASLCLAPLPGIADEVPDAAASQAPAGPAEGAQRRFDIAAYDVEGNSVLQTVDIEEAVYPFLGDGKTVADVDQARDALERAYHARGYQTVQVEIPQQ